MRRRFFAGMLTQKAEIVYLFLDRFITTDDAPMTTPRTAEPGPGTWTITDTGNLASITGGKLVLAGITTGFTDPRLVAGGLSRVVGRALLGTNVMAGASIDTFGTAWRKATTGGSTNVIHAPYFGNGAMHFWGGAFTSSSVIGVVNGVEYQTALVLRSAGCFLLVKGGAYTNWTLAAVSVSPADATLYPSLQHGNSTSTATFDAVKVADLPAPFTDDYGIVTQRLAGARVAGDAFTHEADCLIEFTATAIPSANNIDLRFRKQDDTNYWQVTISSTGAITLNEVVGGSATGRGTSAGAVSNGHRCVIIASDTTIRVYVNNVFKINYVSAVNFKTATAGVLSGEGTGGDVREIISWPRTLSGAAKAALDAL